MYDELSTQFSIATASKEAAVHSHEIPSHELATVFVQEVCAMLGIEPIEVLPSPRTGFCPGWLDLCRRSGLYGFLADGFLEGALRARGVEIAEEPSVLAASTPRA
jgi:hypothetical protein